jgi:hypothetical protein
LALSWIERSELEPANPDSLVAFGVFSPGQFSLDVGAMFAVFNPVFISWFFCLMTFAIESDLSAETAGVETAAAIKLNRASNCWGGLFSKSVG